MTSIHATRDPLLALVARQIELDESSYQAEKQLQSEARAARQEANEEAVQALHDKAQAVWRGALVQGAISGCGGLLQATGAAMSYAALSAQPAQASASTEQEAALRLAQAKASALTSSGQALAGVAGPLSQMTGEAQAIEHDATSARARDRAEQLGWQADDAGDRAQRADRQADGRLDALRGLLDAKREAMSAILSKI